MLGVNGVCIIAHGSSSPMAIKNAIRRARELIEKKINEHIQEDIEENLEDQDLWMRKGILWKNLKDTINFGSEDDEENGDIIENKPEMGSDPKSEDKP